MADKRKNLSPEELRQYVKDVQLASAARGWSRA